MLPVGAGGYTLDDGKAGRPLRLDFFHRVEPVIRGLRTYHQHHVRGLEHVPRRGRALVVINHSLATYDATLLGHAVHEATGRFIRGLGDRLLFRIPLLGRFVTELGGVEGSPANARRLLEQGHLVLVAPGGMREALRPSREAFRIDWAGRLGFARLAAETRTPVILASCPFADNLYTVYPCALTRFLYESFRVPLPVARGLGPTWLPRPVALSHTLSEPIIPSRATTERGIRRFHATLVARMEAQMLQDLKRMF